MTILSTKKPTNNNNRDASAIQQPQQQQQQQQPPIQQQQQQPLIPVLTRTRTSHDDEHNNSEVNLTDDTIETTDVSASSLIPTGASNTHSMPITTNSSAFVTNSKRKSNHHHNQHFNQAISKQTRRRCPSMGETSSSNEENHPTSSLITTNQSSDENGQHNSEDEYEQGTVKYDRNNLNEHEMRFVRALKEKKGFVIKAMQEDGACLFRAVSDQVFGDEEMHSTVRENCMDYIVKNADFFRAYITEDFDHYITRKRRQNCHGNHIEMIALSELYNRPIEVYEYSTEPINIVHGMFKTDNEPIRLSYHCSVHYNSIVDPWRPTAGHGLGLPDLQPGRAQESLLNTALRQSEESHIERTMLDDKLAATDWEATQDELIQQIARESYLQWLCDTSQSKKDEKTTSDPNSSQTTSNSNAACSSHHSLPLRLDERKDCEFALPFHYQGDTSANPDYGDDEDDDSLMRQVLAMSQIEYVETLKKQQEHSSKSSDPNQPSSSSNNDFL